MAGKGFKDANYFSVGVPEFMGPSLERTMADKRGTFADGMIQLCVWHESNSYEWYQQLQTPAPLNGQSGQVPCSCSIVRQCLAIRLGSTACGQSDQQQVLWLLHRQANVLLTKAINCCAAVLYMPAGGC